MAKRVTIQDIADELRLSRNTVSKAINNTGVLSESTRKKVLAKAVEMGYKQFSYMDLSFLDNPSSKKEAKEIVLLTASFLNNSHFASTMLDKFQAETSRLGYSLSLHNVAPNNLASKTLPPSIKLEHIAGIVCVELFDADYCRMLSDLDIPLLMIDAPVLNFGETLNADILLMENTSGILSFIHEMKTRNCTSIGFIGDINHCLSFSERFIAFRNGMYFNSLPIKDEHCIIGYYDYKKTGITHQEFLIDHFMKLESFPDAFICANDFIAMDVIQALRSFNLSCPEDIMLLGFDDSSESRIISPPLSTVHIHSQTIGYSAVELLISRIREPGMEYRRLYVNSDLIYRESTRN
ncbi:LacI family DNA-binding transcriptional regulator [Lachnobacterium bovis]|uniref:LacI family transcriptional regulator n=1 Tax=Lachnobacterium bovis TaxID=140626 RepID=A0A1H9R1T0_9FIRM|nr:LacI family DNA-binding transcriptional regulator [Lachnobacterium bovis]SER65933.1 LacI family transcriptional regulator [Lachnobacterium bovis]